MLSDKSDSEGGLSAPLPPGFRFHPTDEELVRYYLAHKIASNDFFEAIGEVDFNKCEPWDLPTRTKIGEGMFYFFSLRDRKYPTGMRTNRATEAGYWKATGKDREVLDSDTGKLVGMKKTLVFYTGRAPKGEKTNWIMHEYRLEGEATAPHQQEWVICRVFEKSAPGKKPYSDFESTDDVSSNSGQPFTSLPGLQNLDIDSPAPNSNNLNYLGAGFSPSELLGSYNFGATIPGQETTLRRPSGSTADISTSRVRREAHLGDSIEHLVSYWDTYTPAVPDWNWDANPGGHGP